MKKGVFSDYKPDRVNLLCIVFNLPGFLVESMRIRGIANTVALKGTGFLNPSFVLRFVSTTITIPYIQRLFFFF